MDSWTRVDDRDRAAETEAADSDSRTWAIETLRGLCPGETDTETGSGKTDRSTARQDRHTCMQTHTKELEQLQ